MSRCKFWSEKKNHCKLEPDYLCCEDPEECDLYQDYILDVLKDEEDEADLYSDDY